MLIVKHVRRQAGVSFHILEINNVSLQHVTYLTMIFSSVMIPDDIFIINLVAGKLICVVKVVHVS